MTRLTTAQREQKEADRQVALLKQITEDAHRTAREETARADIGFVPPMDQPVQTIHVPAVPGPRKQLCYVSPPLDGSGGNPMLHCDRAAQHSGLHSWELTARLEKAEAELAALRGVRVTTDQDQDLESRGGTMEIRVGQELPQGNAGDSSTPAPEPRPDEEPFSEGFWAGRMSDQDNATRDERERAYQAYMRGERWNRGDGNMTPLSKRVSSPPHRASGDASAMAPEGWRPIATAPNETLVLLWWPFWCPTRPVIGRFGYKGIGQWVAAEALEGDGDEPTHWMPLPQPPAVDGGDD